MKGRCIPSPAGGRYGPEATSALVLGSGYYNTTLPWPDTGTIGNPALEGAAVAPAVLPWIARRPTASVGSIGLREDAIASLREVVVFGRRRAHFTWAVNLGGPFIVTEKRP